MLMSEGAVHLEHEIIIRPSSGWIAIDWRELWEHRELLGFLVMRDIKVRYKQTVLGAAWAILQPVLATLIFTVIFGHVAKMPSEDAPYAVFAYAALLPWTFFSTGVAQAGQSLVNQQALLTKIYLPRMFIPAAPIGGALVDLAISFGVFGVILVLYGQAPGWGVALVPILVLLAICAATGMGLLLAALTATYRDFRYIIPFMMQIWMYVSPVVWSVGMVPERYRWIVALNPLTGIIEGFRAGFLDRQMDWILLETSTATSMLLLGVGMFYFRKTERRFADIA